MAAPPRTYLKVSVTHASSLLASTGEPEATPATAKATLTFLGEEAASEPEELIACSEQRCSIHARVVVPVCCRDDNQAIQALRWFANLASKADNTSTAFADPLARLVFRVRWLQQVAPSAP